MSVYLLLIFVMLTSPWTWKIIQNNLIIVICLMINTLLLSELLKTIYLNVTKKVLVFMIMVLSIFIFLLVINEKNFDDRLINYDFVEISLLNTRRSLYPDSVGRIFQNKVMFSFDKYLNNLYRNLDLNLYFFSNHPRERVGVNEFEKFYPFVLPFFILGIIKTLKEEGALLWLLFGISSLLVAFVKPSYYLGPLLLFPFVVIFIVNGLIVLKEVVLKYAKNKS